jgi:hypothetical protein
MARGRSGPEPDPHAGAHELHGAGSGGTLLGFDIHFSATGQAGLSNGASI